MIVIDNDYMINNRGLDLQARLKVKDNQSGAVRIFCEQLSFRLYDYILGNSTRFGSYAEVDSFINQLNKFDKDMYKRALAEQAIYILSQGDINYLRPDGSLNYGQWQSMRICPQTKDIIRNLGLLEKSAIISTHYGIPHYRNQNYDDEFME